MRKGKTKIVIWGCGFLGKHLLEKLHKDNLIYIINRNGKGVTEYSKLENVIEFDEKRVSEIGQADIMFFLAWDGTSGDKRGSIDVQLENVKLTCHAVQCAADLRCKKFIYAGSIMEYEAISYLNQDESVPGRNYIYNVSKLAADYYGKILANELKVEYCNALISNIYGPGEISQRFVVTMCKKIVKDEKLELTEGQQLYDFIYIEDAVSALEIVGMKGKNNCTYYIGNKEQYPLKSFIIRMKEVLNSNSELLFGAVAYTGVSLKYNEFNTSALYELGFENKITFEEGIKRTAEWLKKEGYV